MVRSRNNEDKQHQPPAYNLIIISPYINASYTIPEYDMDLSFPSVGKRVITWKAAPRKKNARKPAITWTLIRWLYTTLEEESREDMHYDDGLMTAIVAGETALATSRRNREA